jgi:hypothetical protein
LDVPSHKQRVEWVRDLMHRALRSHRRDGPKLELVFDAAARVEVQTLARQEKACCAFLDFALVEADGRTTLTITVPSHAADAADDLLAPFNPPGAIPLRRQHP